MSGKVIVRVTSAIRCRLNQAHSSPLRFTPTTPSTSFRFAHRERAAARVASTPVPILAGEPLTSGRWLRTGEYGARTNGALDAITSQREAGVELVAQRQREG
jgi:hypothetical protein